MLTHTDLPAGEYKLHIAYLLYVIPTDYIFLINIYIYIYVVLFMICIVPHAST